MSLGARWKRFRWARKQRHLEAKAMSHGSPRLREEAIKSNNLTKVWNVPWWVRLL